MNGLISFRAIFYIIAILILITPNMGCDQPTTTTTTTESPATTQAPTTTEAPPTTQAPTTTTEIPAQEELTLEIISITSPVSQGSSATLRARTAPGAQCDITVIYKSGPSEAQGLSPKTADENGFVSWTWKVGTRTTPGTWLVTVTASHRGQIVKQQTSITVTD